MDAEKQPLLASGASASAAHEALPMHPQRRGDGARNSGGVPAAVGSRLLERAAAVKQQLGTYQSADSSTNSPVRNRGSGGSLSSSSSFGNSWALRSGSGGAGGSGGSYGATGGGRADESDAEELAEIISRTPDLDKLFHGDGLPAGERDPNGPAISTTLQSSYGTINESGSDLSHMPASVGSVRDLQEKAAAGAVSASPSVSSALQRQKSLSAAMSPSMPSRSRRNSVGDGDYQSDGGSGGGGIGPEYAALLEELTNPVGRYRRVWLLIVFICVMYNAVAIPFALAFRAIWTDVHVLIVLGVLFYAGDLVFMLDCALYFYTPYTRDGLYERNLPDIRRNYLRSWFLIDFISSAPLDLLFIPFGLHAVLLARLTRFIRFIRLEGAFTVWEKYSTKAPQVVRFMKLMLAVVLILHWLSCFWWFCGITNGLGSTQWLPPAEFRHASVSSQYIVSLFWATNIVTQVGGDPGLPETDFERLSDVVVCFIAVFVVAVIIGTVTELVAELSVSENEMRHKLSGLNNFMDARRLPEELQDRIRSYYFSLWSRRGVDNDGSAAILAELPSNLRTEVSLIMNKDIVGKVPIFQSSSSGFINALVLHLQPQTFMPKEVIVRQGDIGDSMFFISRGHVNVVADGKVFQDNALRTASIQAVNFCDVFVLTRDDLELLFRTFPAEKAIIMHVAETRRAKDLLRKVLSDPQLLAREGCDGFSDPVLVNLLIELFQPLDLSHMQRRRSAGPTPNQSGTTLTLSGLRIDEHGEIVVGDDEEEDETQEERDRAGLLFSPDDRCDQLLFIGKGCVDIFAHRELEEESESAERMQFLREQTRQQRDAARTSSSSDTDSSDSDEGSLTESDRSESESDTEGGPRRPQHVIRLTEGHFLGAISAENYRVSAVIPEEFRGDADSVIIFALNVADLQPLHEFYSSLPSEADVHRAGTAADVEEAAAMDASSARLQMKRTLVTWLQRHRTPLDYVKSMVSLTVHQKHIQRMPAAKQRSLNWKMLLRVIMHKSKAGVRKMQKAAAGAAAKAASKVAAHSKTSSTTSTARTSPAPDVPQNQQDDEERKAEEDGSEKKESPAGHAHAHDHKFLDAVTLAAATESLAASDALSATAQLAAEAPTVPPPVPRELARRVPEHTIIVSPAVDASASASPSIVTEPYHSTYSGAQWDRHSPSAASAPPQQSLSPSATTATLSARPSSPSPGLSSPTSAVRPSLMRSASVGTPQSPHGQASPLSPLFNRPQQTRPSGTQEVSELLAQADMAANRRHSVVFGRVRSADSARDQIPEEPQSATSNESAPVGSTLSVHPPIRSNTHSPSLDWLMGAAANGHADDHTNLLTPPSQMGHGLARPDLRRVPSGPHHGAPIRSPTVALPRSMPPLSGRSRSQANVAALQPFNFLLGLPSQHSGPRQPSPSPLAPYSPSPTSSAVLSPGKRGSGPSPAVPMSMRRHSGIMAAKRAEFLDRALSNLSSEELLLLANKANLQLYSRMHSAQQQTQQQQHNNTQMSPDTAAHLGSATPYVAPPSRSNTTFR